MCPKIPSARVVRAGIHLSAPQGKKRRRSDNSSDAESKSPVPSKELLAMEALLDQRMSAHKREVF